MAVVVGTPRSLERRMVSRLSRADSSTVRVRAARSEIFAEKDSRVRETAWRMRSRKPSLGSSADSSADASGLRGSLLPKREVIIFSSLIARREQSSPGSIAVPFGDGLQQFSDIADTFSAELVRIVDRVRYSLKRTVNRWKK